MGAFLQLLQDFFYWFWHGLNPPKRKPWGAIFYFVAQEDAKMKYPETALDQKLEETINALTSVKFDDATIHVVYRAIWADTYRDPIAKVVNASIPIETTYFSGCSTDVTTPVTTTTDLPCFLKWAYKWCPADHYALFFWGHSFGPAGLFEPGGGIPIPKPGLSGLREAFEMFNLLRRPAGDTPGHAMANGGVGPGLTATQESVLENALQNVAGTADRVDMVLFQDCWMSTLETAYELRSVVKYVIASQSLVPSGKGLSDFIWPYEQLLGRLGTAGFETRMANDLYDFHHQHFNDVSPPLISVPITLLFLDGVAGVTQPLKDLINVLNAMSLPARAAEITKGQIVAFDTSSGDLAAGDVALIDMLRLCQALQTTSGPLGAAAKALIGTFGNLVLQNSEVFPKGGTPTGFTGVSALYKPAAAPANDPFITQALIKSMYLSLLFSQETAWPGAEQ